MTEPANPFHAEKIVSGAENVPGRDWIRGIHRMVVKIGSRALVDEHNHLDLKQLDTLTRQMAEQQRAGRQIICVTSGAVAAGLGELGLKRKPDDLPTLQAAAAVGQARLIELYRQRFSKLGLVAAQVLLTHPDLRSRERHLNARNTLMRLLDANVIPIINENDTVSVEEIRFGDNDKLSALVANLVDAELLVLLTVTDGLLTAPPDAGGVLIPYVEQITDETHALAGGAGSNVSKGGMRTKVQAAEVVTRSGHWAIIAHGRADNILRRLMAGEQLGTLFKARPEKMPGKKQWIAFFDNPAGDVRVDDGAATALTQRGSSLLAAGITEVIGEFPRGASVRILSATGSEVGRGLVNYSSADLRRIAGKRTPQIAEVLGTVGYGEVIHRDNLALP